MEMENNSILSPYLYIFKNPELISIPGINTIIVF